MWSTTITPEGDHSVSQDIAYKGKGGGRGRGGKRRYSHRRRSHESWEPEYPEYPSIVRPIFDWSEIDEHFPHAPTIMDYSLLTQLLQKQVQEISPSLEEQSTVQGFSNKVVTVMENMILTGEGEPLLLEEVRGVGSYKKGTVLTGTVVSDIVVMFRELPTDPILTRLAEKIVQTLEEAEKDQQLEQTDKQTDPSPTQGQGIKISLSETGFDLVCTNGPVEATARIYGTSTGDVVYGVPAEEMPHFESYSHALRMIRHARWFEEETAHLKSVRSLVLILKSMRKHVPGLAALNVWYIELLCHCAVLPLYSNEPLSLVDSFRRVFQLLSAGLFLPGSVGLPDPCEEGDCAIHENLKPEQCDQLARDAQMILVMLQFGAYREVLGCEGADPANFTQPYSFGGITLNVPPPAYLTQLQTDSLVTMTTT